MPIMTGAAYLAEALKEYGVSHVFFVPAVLRRTLVEMERRTEIKRIRTNGEKAAAYMADGYARASRTPGICMAQTVGALNIAAGVRDGFLACSPIIVFTGGGTPFSKYRKAYQENDDFTAFDKITKFNATIEHVSRIPDLLRQAFRVATSCTPGPVHLQLLGNEGQVDTEETEMEVCVEKQCMQVPSYRPQANTSEVEETANLLESALRPVIVAGGGVRWSGAQREVLEIAQKLQIPVATSLNGKDTIPGDHPLSVGVVGRYSRKSANQVVQESDLVFFIGSQTGGMTTYSWQVPQAGKNIVQLDINPENIGRNYAVKASIVGDAKNSLRHLILVTDGTSAGRRRDWIGRVRSIVHEWRNEAAPLLHSDMIPVRPERIIGALSKLLPPDALLVSDTGHAGMWSGGYLDLSIGQSYIRSGGHLGWAFPAALGAKCACPERPVVCFSGDAGFLYHIGEIETALRWGIKGVIIVNNNGAGNQSKLGFDRAYGGKQTEKGFELWGLKKLNFAEIAKAFGANGIRVERPNDLTNAIEKGLAADKLCIIDVVTDADVLAPLAYGGKRWV